MRAIVLLVAAGLSVNLTTGWAMNHYVDPNSPLPTVPFTGWTTAAHTIQDAVDAAVAGDEVGYWRIWIPESNVPDFLLLSARLTGINLDGPRPLFLPVTTGIPGQDGTTSYVDTNAAGARLVLYRVGVANWMLSAEMQKASQWLLDPFPHLSPPTWSSHPSARVPMLAVQL